MMLLIQFMVLHSEQILVNTSAFDWVGGVLAGCWDAADCGADDWLCPVDELIKTAIAKMITSSLG